MIRAPRKSLYGVNIMNFARADAAPGKRSRLTFAGRSPSWPALPRGASASARFAFEQELKSMFAVVRTGGKQYRVAEGDVIAVEKIAGEAGSTLSLGEVLLAGDGGELKDTKGVIVSAEILEQGKGEKVIIFKKKRRHNYRRKNGHRQQLTVLRILGIGDEKKAAPKKAAAKTADAKDEAPKPAEPIKGGEPAKPEAKPAAREPAKKAPVKKAPVRKAAPASAKASADKPAKAVAEKAPAKASADKPAAAKAPAKKAVAKKTAAKKPAAKSAAKKSDDA